MVLNEGMVRGLVTYFHSAQFEETGRSYGFVCATVNGADQRVWFGTDSHIVPLASLDGIIPGDDSEVNGVKEPPAVGDWLALRLGVNKKGPFARRWCWASEWRAAEKQYATINEEVLTRLREQAKANSFHKPKTKKQRRELALAHA
jgi:hypothetical protein